MPAARCVSWLSGFIDVAPAGSPREEQEAFLLMPLERDAYTL